MAGQSSGHTLESVRSTISSIKEMGGVSSMETSTIGGAGRKGSDGNGQMVHAPHKNIAEEFMSKQGGSASTGMTGPDSGYGKTF